MRKVAAVAILVFALSGCSTNPDEAQVGSTVDTDDARIDAGSIAHDMAADAAETNVEDVGRGEDVGRAADVGKEEEMGQPLPTLAACGEQCSVDEDCYLFGMPSTWRCENSRCVIDQLPVPPCARDADCVLQAQGFFLGDSDDRERNPDSPCTSTREWSACPPGESCCPVGTCLENGWCARTAPCSDPWQDSMAATDLDGDPVDVCVNPNANDATCDAGTCRNPCNDNIDCRFESGLSTCDMATGDCTCTGNDVCEMFDLARGPVCFTTYCGCGSDADCARDPNGGTCDVDTGRCYCGDAVDCSGLNQRFDGTTFVCE